MKRALPWILFVAAALAFAWWIAHGERSDVRVQDAVESGARELTAAPHFASVPAPEPAARAPLEPAPERAGKKHAVRVRTAASFARDAASVANVAFQVFPRREHAAEPRRKSFLPPVPIAPGDAAFYSGRTGGDGEARFELDLAGLQLSADGLPQVCVRVVEPGFQQQVYVGRAAKDEPGLLDVVLMAARGATARGRVVDSGGAASSADVRLCRWIAPNGVRKLNSAGSARLLADGWFELHLGKPLEDVALLADAGELGTGTLADVDIPLEDPPQDLRIVVHGEGSLRGRIVDASGAPAAGVDVLVLLATLDDREGSAVMPEPDFSLRQLEGLGRLAVMLGTDADGRFTARGLRPEPYIVRARTGQGYQGGYPILLTPAPVMADGVELNLSLERPSLVVRLLDAEGRAWSAPAGEARRPELLFRKESSLWPEMPSVMVFACDAPDGEPCVAGELLAGKPLHPSEIVYEIEDGTHYLVGVLGAGFDGVPRAVEVPAGSGPVVVEQRARSLGEMGTVVVHVLHAGAGLEGGYGGERFDVRLEGAASSAPLLSLDTEEDPAPFVLRAPAGSYRVAVEGQASRDSWHGTLLHSRTLGRAEAEIELRPGLTQELTLEIDAGAKLEVTLEGQTVDADREAARVTDPSVAFQSDPAVLTAELARCSALAELHLLTAGRRREPVLRVASAFAGTSAAGGHLLDEWPLGEPYVSECVPSGRHTLIARLPGGREARAEVELSPGVTTKVTLRF